MADDADIAFYLIEGGMNAATNAARLPETQYARLVNGSLFRSLPTTRCGCRMIALTGDNLPFFTSENVQGGLFYNPAEGQGAVAIGKDDAMLAFGIGGRKFVVRIEGDGFQTAGKVSDITNGLITPQNLHIVNFSQWENYLIAGDGSSRTFIFDGANPAFPSDGYDTTNKPASRVPNAGTVMAYSHARGSIVVNSRFVLTGDLAFAQSFTVADDVLKFTEQVYWATGQYFASPTKMGVINASAPMPIKDTNNGQGDTLFHCDKGIFSLDLNVFPRSEWSSSAMVKDTYLGGGAAGPYAVDSWDGDQLFRAKSGVKTLRSARAEAEMLGSPQKPISDTVSDFFAADTAAYLRFACVKTWEEQRRAFVTCYPIVESRFWSHRGIVSLNFDPIPAQKAAPSWEGLWTVPVEAGRVCMMLAGQMGGRQRFFAICRNTAGVNHLVEFDPSLHYDVIADGTRRAIRCQLITRKLDLKRPFSKKQFRRVSLFLTNIQGRVDWGLWYRVAGQSNWKLLRSGMVASDPICGELKTLAGNPPADPGGIELGDLPEVDATTRSVQFLLRWAGYCSAESIRITYAANATDPDAGNFEEQRLALCVPLSDSPLTDYSDFEYAEKDESQSWLASLPKTTS